MKKAKKLLSLLLSAALMIASAVVCSVTASAKADKTAAFEGSFNSTGAYRIDMFLGDSPYSASQLSSAITEIKGHKIDSVVYIFLLSDGENCYGFINQGLIEKVSGGSYLLGGRLVSQDLYVYPVEIPEDKIEDKLSLNSFKILGDNGRDICMNHFANSDKKGRIGFSCLINQETDAGNDFLAKLSKCKKGYYTVMKTKQYKYSTLDGDDVTYTTFKPSLNLEGYKEPEETDHSHIDITSLKINPIPDQTYTGKALKPDVDIFININVPLKKGTDYKLGYKNNKNIGTASVTISMTGKYKGTKTLTFKIVPKATTIKKASKTSSKFNLSWSKVSGISGYQIQYSTDGGSTFKNGGTVSASKTSCSLSLNTNKKHIFRIRTYKTVNGTKYYSAWSKTVTVKK